MITIHTLTQFAAERLGWLCEAQASVAWQLACLPARRAQYVVVRCADFVADRWSAMHAGELVGFVDDDDLVRNGAIAHCTDALERSGAGVAFTFDELIDAEGRSVALHTQPVTYDDIAARPYALRQFALLRRDAIAADALEIGRRWPHALDWAIKASVALRHGAVQVPVVGYSRRRHGRNMSLADGGARAQIDAAREHIACWLGPHRGRVPQIDLEA